MRRVLTQSYQPDPEGPRYGRIVRPQDMLNVQEFMKSRVDSVARDFIMRESPAAYVAGFDRALPGGMNLSVGAGHALDAAGRSFDTYPAGQASVVQIPAAHAALPRVDLVYAALAADQDAEVQLLPHRRVRTQLEYEQNVPEYDPVNYNVPTERRNAAVVAVRQGVADANPVAPATGANEVPLYHVRVGAGAVAIAAPDVTDMRSRLRSLHQLAGDVLALQDSPAVSNFNESVDDRVALLLADSTYLTRVYDDAGNLLTLDADIPAFDARYVNTAGDTMAGQLFIYRNQGDTATPYAVALRVRNGEADGQEVGIQFDNNGKLGTIRRAFSLSSAGRLSFYPNDDYAATFIVRRGGVEVAGGLPSEQHLVVRAAAAQTANIAEWRNSADSALLAVSAAGDLLRNGQKVIGTRRPAVDDANAPDAGPAYTANEQYLLNQLKAQFNGLLIHLRASTGHGLIAG